MSTEPRYALGSRADQAMKRMARASAIIVVATVAIVGGPPPAQASQAPAIPCASPDVFCSIVPPAGVVSNQVTATFVLPERLATSYRYESAAIIFYQFTTPNSFAEMIFGELPERTVLPNGIRTTRGQWKLSHGPDGRIRVGVQVTLKATEPLDEGAMYAVALKQTVGGNAVIASIAGRSGAQLSNACAIGMGALVTVRDTALASLKLISAVGTTVEVAAEDVGIPPALVKRLKWADLLASGGSTAIEIIKADDAPERGMKAVVFAEKEKMGLVVDELAGKTVKRTWSGLMSAEEFAEFAGVIREGQLKNGREVEDLCSF